MKVKKAVGGGGPYRTLMLCKLTLKTAAQGILCSPSWYHANTRTTTISKRKTFLFAYNRSYTTSCFLIHISIEGRCRGSSFSVELFSGVHLHSIRVL